jgi:hypothetical protein
LLNLEMSTDRLTEVGRMPNGDGRRREPIKQGQSVTTSKPTRNGPTKVVARRS